MTDRVFVLNANKYAPDAVTVEQNIHVYSSIENLLAALKPFTKNYPNILTKNKLNLPSQLVLLNPQNHNQVLFRFDIYEAKIDDFFPNNTNRL